MLVSAIQLQKEINHLAEPIVYNKGKIQKETAEILEEIPQPEPTVKGKILGPEENMEKRKEMISAKGFEPTDFAYERAIGANDSLYSNFTELIALTKRKVGRIVSIQNSKKTGFATGFMVSSNLLMTNWHVFQDAAMSAESEVHFFYEYNVQGHPVNPVIFRFNPSQFFANEELDYCLVGVNPTDVTQTYSLSNIGYLFLDKGLGKIGEVNKERLNIIHHPQGDYKQISIRENTFTGIDETRIFYHTDTAQGSSGSPVFNDQWQVVGLHHKSVAKMNKNEDFLDINGNIIPIVNGKIDVAKVVWLANEGMRISVILEHLAKLHPNDTLLAGLSIPPPQEILSFGSSTNTTTNNFVENKSTKAMYEPEKNITINVPTNALSIENSIEISLSSKKLNTPAPVVIAPAVENKLLGSPVFNELQLEIAKATREQEIDFSLCKGYDSRFLDVDIPMPQPSESLKNQIALLKDKTNELKYHKYSVIFNALTKMPAISAINVEGDATKRLDKSKRSDNWLRDKRIDIECQLTDKFYSGSNFDKGHMSRFEDANWDNSESEALRNGIFTCFYTNACPQVVKLNRGGGFWGKLEKAILENGIKDEAGRKARMTVFNGPIFNESTDRIFKGLRIPMEFFKIIVWVNDNNQVKATAFKLTQKLLVDHIKFDESMRIDLEALDIDKDVKFKNFQCSIKSLSELTRIDFGHLEQYDTFKPQHGQGDFELANLEMMELD